MSTTTDIKKLSRKKVLLYSFLPLIALVFLVEGISRIAEITYPPLPADIGLGFTPESHLFVPDPDHSGYLVTNPAKCINPSTAPAFVKYLTGSKGYIPFQWQTFPLEKRKTVYRIFFLGESSVNYANNPLQAMARRLEKRFPQYDGVEVINCGGCAYGSHRLVFILSEILQYNPDAVFLYAGHNEFEEQEQLKFADLKSAPLQKLIDQSAFLRTVRDRLALFQMQRIYDPENQRLMEQKIAPWKLENRNFTKEETLERMAAFRKNLELMAQLTHTCGIPFVVGSIPSNLIKPDLLPADKERYDAEVVAKYNQGDYDGGKKTAREFLKWIVRHQSSDLENGILRDVATEWSLPFAEVYEKVEAAEPHHVPGETLFSDHCHLNEKGNEIFVAAYEEIAAELMQQAAQRAEH